MRITTIDDYVDQVQEKFPELSKQEVKRILDFGWKMILQCVRRGNDVLFLTHNFMFFIGKLTNNSLYNFQKYCIKLAKRIRFMFVRRRFEWDGYYYFARTEKQYKEYIQQHRKKYKTFENVMLYKLLEELKVENYASKYIFRVKEDLTSRYKKFYTTLRTKNAELIIQRDPLNIQDLMTSQNKYKYIYGTSN